jgi:hypothetical protein
MSRKLTLSFRRFVVLLNLDRLISYIILRLKLDSVAAFFCLSDFLHLLIYGAYIGAHI